jgi:5,6-dimethylbenzimidazole synthase
MTGSPAFDTGFSERLLALIDWRRDVRRFRRDPLAPELVTRLVEIACLAPSVGLSQPWRFVSVRDPARRAAIRRNFERCNADALAAQDQDRAAHYARLKLAGLDDAPVHLAVFADRATQQGHGLGRHTMPEMLEYSVAVAIHTLWLAARAQGIGVGWVSILDPAEVAKTLDIDAAWKLIGYLCIGYPEGEDDTPALQREGWEQRRLAEKFLVQRR